MLADRVPWKTHPGSPLLLGPRVNVAGEAGPRSLWAIALVLLALELLALDAQRGQESRSFVTWALLQGAAYVAATAVVWNDKGHRRRTLVTILCVAAVLRLGPLLGPPAWSTDINRYVWDGWVQRAGFNPYCCVPVDARLAHLRDTVVFPAINRSDFARTIYPPVDQMAFLANAWLGGTVLSMKLLLVAVEGVGIWAMMAVLRATGRSPSLVLLYAWHPLPIWEIAGGGHVDALLVAFIPLAVLAALAGRQALAGVALGAAVLTKLYPLVFVPALWRRTDWRLPVALLATIVVGYLPYAGVGWRALGYLPDYVQEEKLTFSSGQGFWLLDSLRSWSGIALPTVAYLAVTGAILAVLAARALRDADVPRDAARMTMAIGVTGLLLLSPHFAWYFVLAVALATMSPYPPAIWLGLSAFLLFLGTEDGRVPGWMGAILYGGFVLVALAWHLGRRSPRLLGIVDARPRA